MTFHLNAVTLGEYLCWLSGGALPLSPLSLDGYDFGVGNWGGTVSALRAPSVPTTPAPPTLRGSPVSPALAGPTIIPALPPLHPNHAASPPVPFLRVGTGVTRGVLCWVLNKGSPSSPLVDVLTASMQTSSSCLSLNSDTGGMKLCFTGFPVDVHPLSRSLQQVL